jgi:tRNA (adenine22-N1)-methyltransferase
MRLKPPTLSPRLATVAAQVPLGSRVVDVGTDHGKLPVVLLAEGRATHVLAVDISRPALEGAAHRVEIHELSGRMEARVSDGLRAVQPGEADVVTICGMGGHRMRRILEAGPLAGITRLILQANRDAQMLADWLPDFGWTVAADLEVEDAGRSYRVLVAEPR